MNTLITNPEKRKEIGNLNAAFIQSQLGATNKVINHLKAHL